MIGVTGEMPKTTEAAKRHFIARDMFSRFSQIGTLLSWHTMFADKQEQQIAA